MVVVNKHVVMGNRTNINKTNEQTNERTSRKHCREERIRERHIAKHELERDIIQTWYEWRLW